MITAMFAIGVTLTTTGLTALAGLVVAIIRDPGRPTVPGWRPGELTALATEPGWMRPACPICSGRHCAGCEEPARVTSLATGYTPRHDFSEVPPSALWLAEQVHVTFRGALITASLVGRHVCRPADGTAFRLWAKRRLGRELQLGGPRPLGVLP